MITKSMPQQKHKELNRFEAAIKRIEELETTNYTLTHENQSITQENQLKDQKIDQITHEKEQITREKNLEIKKLKKILQKHNIPI